jgi:uncharacterized protein
MQQHCTLSKQDRLSIVFHGGEPCLMGLERFDAWCTRARSVLKHISVEIGIQTNGTLLDEGWAASFRKHDVQVGLSLDGPKQLHDAFRIDHSGRGSYDAAERGFQLLDASGVRCGILSVIPLGADPLQVHRHFLSLGCRDVTYLLPYFTHDTISPIRRLYGPTPCADFLIPIFDDWWFNGTLDLRIGNLWDMSRAILGGRSRSETLGNAPPGYVFVETDGGIEGLDCLRACAEGITDIHINVRTANFAKILSTDSMHKTAIFRGMPLPTGCAACHEQDTCAGGYLPTRYSSVNGFDNPSVWCADLLKLFAHLRDRMGVPVEQTGSRRLALQVRPVTASLSLTT